MTNLFDLSDDQSDTDADVVCAAWRIEKIERVAADALSRLTGQVLSIDGGM